MGSHIVGWMDLGEVYFQEIGKQMEVGHLVV